VDVKQDKDGEATSGGTTPKKGEDVEEAKEVKKEEEVHVRIF